MSRFVMQVFVDQCQVDCPVPPDRQTIGGLVEAIRNGIAQERIVIAIAADGESITGAEYDAALLRPANAHGRYDFTTCEPAEVVREALAVCEELLRDAEQLRRQVIERLTQGDSAEGLKLLGQCCGAWRQVHETLAGAIGLSKLDTTLGGRPIREALADFKAPLLQIRDALQAHDFVLISDVLEYEFDSIVANWRSMLAGMEQSLAAAPAHET